VSELDEPPPPPTQVSELDEPPRQERVTMPEEPRPRVVVVEGEQPPPVLPVEAEVRQLQERLIPREAEQIGEEAFQTFAPARRERPETFAERAMEFSGPPTVSVEEIVSGEPRRREPPPPQRFRTPEEEAALQERLRRERLLKEEQQRLAQSQAQQRRQERLYRKPVIRPVKTISDVVEGYRDDIGKLKDDDDVERYLDEHLQTSSVMPTVIPPEFRNVPVYRGRAMRSARVGDPTIVYGTIEVEYGKQRMPGEEDPLINDLRDRKFSDFIGVIQNQPNSKFLLNVIDKFEKYRDSATPSFRQQTEEIAELARKRKEMVLDSIRQKERQKEYVKAGRDIQEKKQRLREIFDIPGPAPQPTVVEIPEPEEEGEIPQTPPPEMRSPFITSEEARQLGLESPESPSFEEVTATPSPESASPESPRPAPPPALSTESEGLEPEELKRVPEPVQLFDADFRRDAPAFESEEDPDDVGTEVEEWFEGRKGKYFTPSRNPKDFSRGLIPVDVWGQMRTDELEEMAKRALEERRYVSRKLIGSPSRIKGKPYIKGVESDLNAAKTKYKKAKKARRSLSPHIASIRRLQYKKKIFEEQLKMLVNNHANIINELRKRPAKEPRRRRRDEPGYMTLADLPKDTPKKKKGRTKGHLERAMKKKKKGKGIVMEEEVQPLLGERQKQ
jgi:hypothetical protein